MAGDIADRLGPPVRTAILEEYGTRQMDPEMEALEVGLERLGISVRFAPMKWMVRGRVAVDPETLVAGQIPFVRAALRRMHIAVPVLADYPASLAEFLHRQVWESTVAELRAAVAAGAPPCFAKPAARKKLFNGAVVGGDAGVTQLAGVSGHVGVLCSSVVRWTTEHRFFVRSGCLVGRRCYRGDESLVVDEEVVRKAVAAYEASGEAPVAYSADFGRLQDGRTALVEINDAWGLGAWDLDPDVYTDVIVARWRELVQPIGGTPS